MRARRDAAHGACRSRCDIARGRARSYRSELDEARPLAEIVADPANLASSTATIRGAPSAHGLDHLEWLEVGAREVTGRGRAALQARFHHHVAVIESAALHAFSALSRRL